MPEAALIDGKAFAETLRARIGVAASAFAQATGRRPGLAVVLVGEDPASQVYVGAKGKACDAAGMASFEHRLPADTSEAALLSMNRRSSPRSTRTRTLMASTSSTPGGSPWGRRASSPARRWAA